MPRTRSLHWTELKLGILALLAIVVAAVVIFLVSGEGGFFWQRYRLKAKFDNVAGLKSGAPVRVSGVEVGSVKAVVFNGVDVDVVFELSKDMQGRVTTESTASIGSVSLLGESALDLTASPRGRPLQQDEYVKSKRAPGQLADVAEGATRSLEQATLLLKDIRAGKGTVGKLFTDEALYRDVQGFVDAAEAVAQNLRAGRGSAGMEFAIAPGHPERSFLLHRMESLDPGVMMPELGRQRVDTRGVALIREWIAHMQADGSVNEE